MKKQKNKFFALILAGALLLSLGGLVGCSNTDILDTNGTQAVSFENAYDHSALGGIGLLNSTSGQSVSLVSANKVKSAPTISLLSLKTYNVAPPTSESSITLLSDKNAAVLSDETKTEILNNLAIAQTTVNGGVVKSEIKASELEGYEYTYTISAADITGENKIYTFYYNSIAEDGDDEKTVMEGIVILDGIEYGVRGEREVEEGEEEVDFKVMLDENNYVVIKQEISSEEQEFEYVSYQNGEKVFETKVEYEADEDGEIEMKFKTETDSEEIEYKYEFFSNENGSFVEVKMENNESEIKTLIRILTDENGNVSYEFTTDEEIDGEQNADTSNIENENDENNISSTSAII